MTVKKLAAVVGVLVLIAVIGVIAAGAAFAQTDTPTPAPNAAPTQRLDGRGMMGRGFGFGGPRSWDTFDALAKALSLTPTQLFEQLHSGKTLDEIAKAQGVDLAKIQEAANAARVQAMKDKIAQAVKDGKITQEQADWLMQGMEKGYMGKGRGGAFDFGRGPMRRGGMRGHGNWNEGGSSAPAAPALGTSS